MATFNRHMITTFFNWPPYAQVSRYFLNKVSKKLNQRQIEAVFAKFDANGDGRLSIEEFRQMMEKSNK